jgi:hypothetical protein
VRNWAGLKAHGMLAGLRVKAYEMRNGMRWGSRRTGCAPRCCSPLCRRRRRRRSWATASRARLRAGHEQHLLAAGRVGRVCGGEPGPARGPDGPRAVEHATGCGRTASCRRAGRCRASPRSRRSSRTSTRRCGRSRCGPSAIWRRSGAPSSTRASRRGGADHVEADVDALLLVAARAQDRLLLFAHPPRSRRHPIHGGAPALSKSCYHDSSPSAIDSFCSLQKGGSPSTFLPCVHPRAHFPSPAVPPLRLASVRFYASEPPCNRLTVPRAHVDRELLLLSQQDKEKADPASPRTRAAPPPARPPGWRERERERGRGRGKGQRRRPRGRQDGLC